MGVLERVEHHVRAAFTEPGDALLLLGAGALSGSEEALAGSEYLAHVHNLVGGRPEIDLGAEARLQRLLVMLAREQLLHSAHDCSDGGLAVAIAESAILGGVGASVVEDAPERWDAALFGEGASRAIVSAAPHVAASVLALAEGHGVPAAPIGSIGGGTLAWAGLFEASIAELAAAWESGLERALGRD